MRASLLSWNMQSSSARSLIAETVDRRATKPTTFTEGSFRMIMDSRTSLGHVRT
jgi:hypothetical protein